MTTLNHPMIEKWKPAAMALTTVTDSLSVPIHVLIGEAIDVARFTQRRWKTARDGQGALVAPGLDLVENHALIRAGIDQEIIELHEALSAAVSAFRLTVAPPPEAGPMDRSRFVLDELTGALEYLFTDGVEDENDVRFANLAIEHAESFSQDAVAQALNDYAELAEQNRAALEKLAAFDVGLIAEARALASDLRERSAQVRAQPADVEQIRDLRNRLASLLLDRMNRVRTAARWIFRHHPQIVREVTSAYERRRRAAQRRAEMQRERNGQTQPQPAPQGPSPTP